MLIRVIKHISDFLSQSTARAYLVPLAISPNSNAGPLSIREILDGFLLATPKNRTPIKKIWARRYGNDNWKYGQKLLKPKKNIVTCMECGDFHEIHAICRSCFRKVEEESKKIIDGIKNAWNGGVIDREVQILYQGETAATNQKRIVELERPRPMWFVSNLSQKTANPSKQISGPTKEVDDRIVREKNDTAS